MKPTPAKPGDSAEIVSLVRGGFPSHLMEGLIYGTSGIHHFIEDQLRLAALSPYRYRVIRGEDGLVGAAEFRILGDALFLNYVAVRPDHLRRGLALELISDMRKEASREGLQRLVLDVFTHNEIAINWYVNKWGMDQGEVCRAWVAPQVPDEFASPYLIADFSQAEAIHQKLGFSEITLVGGPAPIRVGRLGARFFRIAGPDLAADPRLRATLAVLDPDRSLLILAPGGHPGQPGWDPLYATQRLQTTI